MFGAILLRAYGGLWKAATPFLRRHQRLADGFEQRLVPDAWPCATGSPVCNAPGVRIWIQAASGGEAWLVHSLIQAFHAQYAGRTDTSPPRLLCTTCTRQGLEVLAKLPQAQPSADSSMPVVLPRYFPLDHPALMDKALAAARPGLLVLLETEIWPGLLSAATKRGVPVLVLNGRMTDKSLSAYRLLTPFWRSVAPARILAISEDDAARFSRLFGRPDRVAVMSNIKFDRMAEAAASGPPPEAARLRREAGIPDGSLLAVFASVREEEEDLLLPVLKALSGLRIGEAPAALAVAPRHMHRVAAWKEKLAAAGLGCVPRSQSVGAPPRPEASGVLPVFLWDTFGELQALYAVSDAAFIGGSLAPLGGQNFLEAPAQGVRAVVGPHTTNFLWAGDGLFTNGLARQVADADALRDALEEELSLRYEALLRCSGGAPHQDAAMRQARAALGQEIRARFLSWLAPHTGGSAVASRAVLAQLNG